MNFMKVFQKIILLFYNSEYHRRRLAQSLYKLTKFGMGSQSIVVTDICHRAILAEVLSEDSIMKWYNGGHSAKGKSVFLEQMKKMVEWLQNAEEGV